MANEIEKPTAKVQLDELTARGCGCAGAADSPADASRRRIFRMVAGIAAGASGVGRVFAAEEAQVTKGDRLVKATAEGEPVALRAADVLAGKPLLVYPFDPASKAIRNGSRLNKLVLVRVGEADLDADTKPRAAAGVLAFSALCTHAGCDVNAWMAKTKRLLCYCHASQFDPLASGKVTDGPAPRSLPWIALALEGDQLAVAGPLSATPGALST